MLTIEIPTNALANADIDEPGQTLAELLRKVADRIESDIHILPHRGEWNTETYREAARIDGVLLGAVITLDKEPGA